MHTTKINLMYIEKLISYIQKEKINIPIAALITKNNNIISIAKNNNQYGNNHAECLSIQKAQCFFKSQTLANCILYTTLEPCLMCVGSAINANIKIIYYACKSHKSGIHSFYNMNIINNINIIYIPTQAKKIESILKNYFKNKRL